MQLHQLSPIHKKKNKKRIGRGGKRGSSSGKGMRGQKSRAGGKNSPIIREYIKRYHKLRGYRFKSLSLGFTVLNLKEIEQVFRSGDVLNPESLLAKGLIRARKGRFSPVKILGKGRITKKITVERCHVSQKAKEKIEKAGGTVKTKKEKVRKKNKKEKAKDRRTGAKKKKEGVKGKAKKEKNKKKEKRGKKEEKKNKEKKAK